MKRPAFLANVGFSAETEKILRSRLLDGESGPAGERDDS